MSDSAAPADSLIRMQSVSKSFGDFKALDRVDLSVASGEKIVICGPSGSGKSTLIRCLSQLEAHDEGQIWIDGISVGSEASRDAQARSEIGMVFQQFNLFPHLSVIDNLMLAPMRVLAGVPTHYLSDEAVVPVEDPQLSVQLEWLLELYLNDRSSAWWMQPDGSYRQQQGDGTSAPQAQQELMELWGLTSTTTNG